MSTVNEESAATFVFRPLNIDGASFTPGTIRYRVDDLSSGAEIIAWTSVTPSTEVTVTIPASAHTMTDSSNTEEIKVLTVQTDFDTDTQHSEETQYTLLNLSFAETPT